MSRLTAVFDCDSDDDDGQPEQDHVAADLGRGLGQPEPQERAVPEDGEGAPGRPDVGRVGAVRLGRRIDVVRRSPVPPGRPAPPGHRRRRRRRATAPVSAGVTPRSTNPTSRRSRVAPLEQDVAPAGLAAEPDVGAQAVDQPGVATARMRSGAGGRRRRAAGSGRGGPARPEGIRAVAGRRSGRGRGRSPGRSIASTGRDLDDRRPEGSPRAGR